MPPTHEPHSARYFARLYSPTAQQVALEALFGIEREVFESLKPGLDHQVAHSRLQWWREECERTVAGRPVHPLTRALVDAISPTDAPRQTGISQPAETAAAAASAAAGLSGLVDVAVWDLANATFESRRELTAYCERWAAGMVGTIAGAGSAAGAVGVAGAAGGAGAADAGHVGEDTRWRAVGAAIREIELLNDLAHEAHHGRLRLPLDELDRAKADPAAVAKPPWPDAVADIVRARHKALRDEIMRGLADVDPERQPTLRGLLVWATLTCRASQRAEQALPSRLQPGRLDPISDAWFAWRVARKATVGRFRPVVNSR